MTRLPGTSGALLALALLTACGSGSTTGGSTTTAPTSAPAVAGPAGATTHCDFTATRDDTGGKPNPGLPPATVPATGTKIVTITLNGTAVTAMVDASKTPCTLASFEHLAAKGFFNGTTCHRLVTSGIYVLQCGDPTGTGTGGPGYTIPDENLGATTLPAGTIAMANTGREHTGGSQFFLCYKDTELPPQYTPFATVTAGLDAVRAIAAKGVDGGGVAPAQKATISAFTVS